MRTTAVWLPLAALCLHAQEGTRTTLSLLADRMRAGITARDYATEDGQPLHYEDSVRPLEGLALRIGRDAFRLGPGVVAFDATYRFRSGSGFRHSLNGQPVPYPLQAKDQLGYSYLAVGGEWSLRQSLEGGLGLEARMEGLDRRTEFVSVVPGMPGFTVEAQSHQIRPWLRAHLEHGFQGPRLEPFVRIEAAWALSRRRAPDPSGMLLAQDLRPLAPQFQAAVAAGIRL